MAKRLLTMPKKPLKIACCLIFDKNNQLLLIRRHPDDFGGGLWALPGGKQEIDEEASTTVIREVNEETGLSLSGVTYLGQHELRMPHGLAHLQSFKAQINGSEEITLDPEEHDSFQWLSLDQVFVEPNVIWGLPTTLIDFSIVDKSKVDTTLNDGSQAILIELEDQA